MRIGFVGLGIMGRPMALNLLRAGHTVTVWARRPESVAPDVAEVMRALARQAPPGLVAADMSTIAPAAARTIHAELAESGIDFVDAPVSGGEPGAIAGTLSIMAGGSETAFARALPAFQCMGGNIVHVGGPGAGQVAKAANQVVTGMGVVAVAEAVNFAQKNGVDAAKVREALLGGFAASKILENHGQRMIEVPHDAPAPVPPPRWHANAHLPPQPARHHCRESGHNVRDRRAACC